MVRHPWNRDLREKYAPLPATFVDRYDPTKLIEVDQYPAEYFRLEIIKKRVALVGGTRLLDIGAGSGIPIVELARQQNTRDAVAFDYTPEMVEYAKMQFAATGLDPEHVFEGDARLADPYMRASTYGPFDVALMLGLFHHIEDQAECLRRIHGLLNPGGRVFIAFRNKLFSLFTMNSFTHALVMSDLLQDISPDIRNIVDEEFQKRLRMDQPKLTELDAYSEASYELIHARKHNPLEMEAWFRAVGYSEIRLHFFHCHPGPPYLEGEAVSRKRYREAAIAMEGEEIGWRGYFMCSGFLVEAGA